MTLKPLLLAAGLTLSSPLWAQTSVQIDEPWVRGTVAQQTATGAFMRLTSTAPVRLVGVRSPVAGVTEIHEMAMEQQVMKMRAVPGVDLAAGRALELKPGGYHVMLLDLKQPVAAGTSVPITLVFQNAQGQRFEQGIEAPVRALGAASGMPMGHGHGHHGHMEPGQHPGSSPKP